ncbi:MAG TPA: hypothetical protein VJV78_15995 [Polyangiales bacterium]|nr:hypothetical protein [Polyangiales bacterium]
MATEVARETKSKERRALKERTVEAPPPSDGATAAPGKRSKLIGRARAAEHAVFLVPGLLGFENFSTFSYFADRVVAALRAGLEQSWLGPVPVLPVPIPPTASLRERQRRLVKTLADRLHSVEHGHTPLSVHLVGHSTGGVDANLLTHDRPLGGGTWADIDPRAPELRQRIRSVISLASPHQGACIARDPLAHLLSARDPRGLPALADVFSKFLASVIGDFEMQTVASSLLREGEKTLHFTQQLFARWELLDDLQPTRDPRQLQQKSDVLRRSFVTIAGRPILGHTETPLEDAFFREMSRRAAGWETGAAETGQLVQASVARLQRALDEDEGVLVLKGAGIELPPQLDAGHNDGVVNAARQLIDPSNADELAGIVVADHFDVVGYYDRYMFQTDEEGNDEATQVLSGLLHSGSGFRDDQFFELYRRIADVIAAGWQ